MSDLEIRPTPGQDVVVIAPPNTTINKVSYNTSRTRVRVKNSGAIPATPVPTSLEPLIWGLIGNDGTKLSQEKEAGINTKLFELSWNDYETTDGVYSSTYITRKQTELLALRTAGFKIILSMGWQTAPTWIYNLPNSKYVNEIGQTYDDTTHGSGRANVIWNPTIRTKVGRYISRVFADFGTDFYAVRVGGGRYGELGYPPGGYWAFDANAISPTRSWKPGQPSPNGEATTFINWYMDKLVEYQTWQIEQMRLKYSGRIMVLYPSWGIRPTQLAAAIAVNLNGSTSAEINGEVSRGYDFARQVAALTTGSVVTSTWLDPNPTWYNDSGTDPRYWSPIKYLASLANLKGLELFGENTGHGQLAQMTQCANLVKANGLLGMLWYREDELFSGTYATITDMKNTITT